MSAKTPLYNAHVKAGARMVDFAGWQMPVQYSSIVAEHEAVRSGAGLFDVSHMGEVEFNGPGALQSANALITNDLSRCADGQALYAGLLNDEGGFIDDVVAYRFSPERILICVNASNRAKDFSWMASRAKGVAPEDASDRYAQLAVQGPKAPALVQRLCSAKLDGVGRYRFLEAEVSGVPCVVSRTGYTGEDGFELYCRPEQAEKLWWALLEEGKPEGLVPAGLGARDTLRTEMKYPLYGNDIDERRTPLEAGLGFAVKLDKDDFVGKAALAAQKSKGLSHKWVGFELLGSGVIRHGYPVWRGGEKVGEVTSGTFGPSVKKAIGMGYVPASMAKTGELFEIEIRANKVPARVVDTPFWKRT
jgi:aminomethyltransferase